MNQNRETEEAKIKWNISCDLLEQHVKSNSELEQQDRT